MAARNVSNVPQGSRASTKDGVPPVDQSQEAPPAQGFAADPSAPLTTAQGDPAGDGSQTAAGNAMAAEEQREELTNVPGESKADKFQRLAKARVTRAIIALRSLSKLNTSAYESTDEQRSKMFATLRKELDASEQAYKPKATTKDAFSF